MGKYVSRHGVSAANVRGNPAFGQPTARLIERGREQSREMGARLPEFGINPATDPAAVSDMTRTQETALEAGFAIIRAYSVLDEVSHGFDMAGYKQMIATRILPAHVMRAAEVTLSNPPEEGFWVCHGLRITAMCQILGIYQDQERIVPRHCEVRYFPID